MGLEGVAVWPMDAGDLDWLVDLAARRRERLVAAAPLFWRPAEDGTDRHRPYLAALLDDEPAVLAVRSRQGYLIALERDGHWLVDDADVVPEDEWATDGVALLRYAEEACGSLRFVVPVVEAERMAAASAIGLFPVEHWWHRDLVPAEAAGTDAAGGAGELAVPGVQGRLVTAPPVYDPGGPVLMVTEVYSVEALRRAEGAAVSQGATVAVVTQRPGQADLATLLDIAGYTLTTAFCEGSH